MSKYLAYIIIIINIGHWNSISGYAAQPGSNLSMGTLDQSERATLIKLEQYVQAVCSAIQNGSAKNTSIQDNMIKQLETNYINPLESLVNNNIKPLQVAIIDHNTKDVGTSGPTMEIMLKYKSKLQIIATHFDALIALCMKTNKQLIATKNTSETNGDNILEYCFRMLFINNTKVAIALQGFYNSVLLGGKFDQQ